METLVPSREGQLIMLRVPTDRLMGNLYQRPIRSLFSFIYKNIAAMSDLSV